MIKFFDYPWSVTLPLNNAYLPPPFGPTYSFKYPWTHDRAKCVWHAARFEGPLCARPRLGGPTAFTKSRTTLIQTLATLMALQSVGQLALRTRFEQSSNGATWAASSEHCDRVFARRSIAVSRREAARVVNDDSAFSPTDLEKVLRATDADAGTLPSRLWDVVNDFDPVKLMQLRPESCLSGCGRGIRH